MTNADAHTIADSAGGLKILLDQLDRLTLTLTLHDASRTGKHAHAMQVLDAACRVLAHDDGLPELRRRAGALSDAGIFAGTDWDAPANLLPRLVKHTLTYAEPPTITLEALSLLRFLTVAQDGHVNPALPPDQARQFLTQVLALNLDRLLGTAADEAQRGARGPLAPAVDRLMRYLMAEVGTESILDNLIAEIWRIMAQRPIQVDHVKSMVVQIALALNSGNAHSPTAHLGADRLISALFGPSMLSREDPGIPAYLDRLARADQRMVHDEALAMARAMHDTGLVSDYHAAFLRWTLEAGHPRMLPEALGLSSTGLDALRCYEALVRALIDAAIQPGTAQAVYGLSLMLERGILYSPPIAPSLWRLLETPLSAECGTALESACGTALPAQTHLIAGVLLLLGQPLGVGQGNNPTCQSARALSMWALNDPDFLLWLIAQVSRGDRLLMHFEGAPLDTSTLPPGLATLTPLDADPVSVLLVPHLDRAYAELGRRCAGRGEDPHRWINPELHGWWVGREFHISVDVATGALKDYEGFLRNFHAAYHPMFNGNQPVIHPQPAGIAVTDANGGFIGWHAITLIRVGLDPDDHMRVYFFNPNNDSGQDWGNGVVVSTHGHGERFGEGSLLFGEFASRLYLFHDDGLQRMAQVDVPDDQIAEIAAMGRATWAVGRADLEV
ncbi:hypothetical protein [Roseicitreum antarcticum]|uniref:hypothetical protein n=1 Tax=Roseicitreum antarcticum TaxID=564137 RepID=UPI000B857827|nr:hypothetical protein [Roseicitreum antarcticum]